MDTEVRKRVGAIDRALQVLDLLTERQQPMTAYDLARSIGAPVSTIYKIADDLFERSMLIRVGENGLWLGPRLMRYGLAYRAHMDLYAEARQEMERLAASVSESIQLCARDEGKMSVIAMVRGEGHLHVASEVGTRVPLNWTASGRLLLGHLDPEERRAIFENSARPSSTGQAETDPDTLARLAGDEFQNRLAVQMGASEYAVACIASPIRDKHGACVLTISIVLPESRAKSELSRLTRAVQDAAENIEKTMGVTLPKVHDTDVNSITKSLCF